MAKNDRRERKDHPLTQLTNAWRQAMRKVESLTTDYNQLVHSAGELEKEIEKARDEQRKAWKAMSEYQPEAPKPLPEAKAEETDGGAPV